MRTSVALLLSLVASVLLISTAQDAQCQDLDFGDAPDSPAAPGYPTLLINNGARHAIGGPQIGLGITHAPDADADGQPDPKAEGDDNDGNHDEQYFYFTTGTHQAVLFAGEPGLAGWYVDGGGGVVEIWIDFNRDRIWQHPGEQVYSAYCADGNHSAVITPPLDSEFGQTFARIRISRAGGLPPDGPADNGEVQDQRVYIAPAELSYKWEQLPDLDLTSPENTRLAVNAADEMILADDFRCTEEGPITDIELWGTWYANAGWAFNDVRFTISFHADIPAEQSATGYSMPGELLWLRVFEPGNAWMQWMEPPENIPIGWYDPSTEEFLYPSDFYHFIYHLHVDEDAAFFQQGSPENPVVYWINVKSETFHPVFPEARFGWMTSLDHWNDNAVWAEGAEPYTGDWDELYYPRGHQYAEQAIDLAFRLGEVFDPSAVAGDPRTAGLSVRLLGPSPLTHATTIGFNLPATEKILLSIHSVDGRHVATLADGLLPAGPHTAIWNGRDTHGRLVPSGCYLYSLTTEQSHRAGRVIVVR